MSNGFYMKLQLSVKWLNDFQQDFAIGIQESSGEKIRECAID